ncbi:MAG: glycine zipper 2TM domain-containing protein, partial [Ralstonia sp.]|nr:glycine zipper 2TM domain-containing protein [Ralstonia sp.]
MEVMRRGDAEQVTVVRVRNVTITGDDGYMSASSGMPGLIGAGISAFLGGRSIGNGNGRYVAGAVSGAVGGVITQQVSQVLNKRPGVEGIVRTDA